MHDCIADWSCFRIGMHLIPHASHNARRAHHEVHGLAAEQEGDRGGESLGAAQIVDDVGQRAAGGAGDAGDRGGGRGGQRRLGMGRRVGGGRGGVLLVVGLLGGLVSRRLSACVPEPNHKT
jgi:hypothetical protein